MPADRNENKLKAIRRAQWRLKQRLETIDWELDVLLPEVEEHKASLGAGKERTYELEAGDEAQDD